MRIVVIGAGALGSHLVLLGRNWDASFAVVDFDRVERKNTLSQFHTKMGLGKNKAQALQQALQGLFALRIEALPRKLEAHNVDALLGRADLVVDCVDNAPTRELISAFVREHGIPCLHGAVAADGSYARVMWDELFTADAGAEGQPTCEDGEHLPFIARVAAHMAEVVQAFLAEGERRSLHLHPGGVVHV